MQLRLKNLCSKMMAIEVFLYSGAISVIDDSHGKHSNEDIETQPVID